MRKSIMQDHNENLCYICGAYNPTDTHHVLSGTANRKKSDEDGLTVKLCRSCHRNIHDIGGKQERILKQAAQWCWEQEYGSREDFIKRYGKSWI